jgi:hypothetical protein
MVWSIRCGVVIMLFPVQQECSWKVKREDCIM